MYDLVFITQLPSFYKVNLYNKISEHKKIKVIFVGKSSVERTKDFLSNSFNFDHSFLSDFDFERRNVLRSIFKLWGELKSIKFQKILCSGWNLPEFIFIFCIYPKEKNIICLESTIIESVSHGLKRTLKKFFLNKVGIVLASGVLHKKLLEAMDYSGQIILTNGVGLINKPPREIVRQGYRKKFLYLGRLAPEKNLEMLIRVFNKRLDYSLSIVGNGPLGNELRQMASANISFHQHVPNGEIERLFFENDFLVLPSKSEPWGLVVEEALYYGIPVIISDRCGASDLVTDGENGKVFDGTSIESLENAIRSISENLYKKMLSNISQDFIDRKDQNQIKAYTELNR